MPGLKQFEDYLDFVPPDLDRKMHHTVANRELDTDCRSKEQTACVRERCFRRNQQYEVYSQQVTQVRKKSLDCLE